MTKKRIYYFIIVLLSGFIFTEPAHSYPIDGYLVTGIRRLERSRLIVEGKLRGPILPKGARKPLSEIGLNLLDERGNRFTAFPDTDPKLQAAIEAIFPQKHESYCLALLDITPGRAPRFAGRQADRQFSPGSVGKLAIAAGLFRELKALFPDSYEKRQEVLRERMAVAGPWIYHDHHVVPIYHPEDQTFVSRPIREGDVFSLYEWADHMLSASANAAASTVWKEIMLMRHFGKAYPPSPEEEQAFFGKTPKNILRDIAMSTVNDPLREAGIGQNEWQLGSFFTSRGKRLCPAAAAAGPLHWGCSNF